MRRWRGGTRPPAGGKLPAKTRAARACLRIDPPVLGVAAYLCQQAAEKILKGLLIIAGVEFALTHDLDRLASTAEPHYPEARALLEPIRRLTLWGIAYRYPGPDPVPEPPAYSDIEQVLTTIDALAERLRALTRG